MKFHIQFNYRIIVALLAALFFFSSSEINAQQIGIFSRGKVTGRYNLGDKMTIVLKSDPKQIRNVAILSIQEFSFVTLQKDTIKFSDISKLKFRNTGKKAFARNALIGGAAIGLLGLALDKPFGDKNPQAIRGMYSVAALGAITGGFLLLTSNSTTKLSSGKNRLKFINYDSPLYQ